MKIETIGKVQLPQTDELQVATRLLPEPSTMEDGSIIIEEMKINGQLSPDVALIRASVNTPVQKYEGEGPVTEIFFSTTDNKPVGVILMSPRYEISLQVYNPKTDGGPRGYTITEGWTMQTIIPDGTTLVFFDYWAQKGFSSSFGDQMYGEVVLTEVSEEEVLEKFQIAGVQLMEYMETL